MTPTHRGERPTRPKPTPEEYDGRPLNEPGRDELKRIAEQAVRCVESNPMGSNHSLLAIVFARNGYRRAMERIYGLDAIDAAKDPAR